jgi:hypothetical protein
MIFYTVSVSLFNLKALADKEALGTYRKTLNLRLEDEAIAEANI